MSHAVGSAGQRCPQPATPPGRFCNGATVEFARGADNVSLNSGFVLLLLPRYSICQHLPVLVIMLTDLPRCLPGVPGGRRRGRRRRDLPLSPPAGFFLERACCR